MLDKTDRNRLEYEPLERKLPPGWPTVWPEWNDPEAVPLEEGWPDDDRPQTGDDIGEIRRSPDDGARHSPSSW